MSVAAASRQPCIRATCVHGPWSVTTESGAFFTQPRSEISTRSSRNAVVHHHVRLSSNFSRPHAMQKGSLCSRLPLRSGNTLCVLNASPKHACGGDAGVIDKATAAGTQVPIAWQRRQSGTNCSVNVLPVRGVPAACRRCAYSVTDTRCTSASAATSTSMYEGDGCLVSGGESSRQHGSSSDTASSTDTRRPVTAAGRHSLATAPCSGFIASKRSSSIATFHQSPQECARISHSERVWERRRTVFPAFYNNDSAMPGDGNRRGCSHCGHVDARSTGAGIRTRGSRSTGHRPYAWSSTALVLKQNATRRLNTRETGRAQQYHTRRRKVGCFASESRHKARSRTWRTCGCYTGAVQRASVLSVCCPPCTSACRWRAPVVRGWPTAHADGVSAPHQHDCLSITCVSFASVAFSPTPHDSTQTQLHAVGSRVLPQTSSVPAAPPSVSADAFYEGEIEEEEETAEDFASALETSEVSTPELAKLWLKLPVEAADADDNATMKQQPATHGSEADAAIGGANGGVGDSCGCAPREEHNEIWEQPEERSARITVEGRGARAEEDHDAGHTGCGDGESGTSITENLDSSSDTLVGEWNRHLSQRRSGSRPTPLNAMPGSTLLSRLALAEREALVFTPRKAKKSKVGSELVGIGGELYPSTRARSALLSRERMGTASDDHLQRLAFDRRQVPSTLEGPQREVSLYFTGKAPHLYKQAGEAFLGSEPGSRRRMRVLDLDSVPAAVLHHSFMFLLVKHMPAEVCMKVISRIATYRDTHTQTAYENLMRDLGFVLCKHYESSTATPHSLGAAFIAYLPRVVQTISIAWSVDYVRRYGCFSKKFIADLIDRSTSPRLFDCVRYEKYGGIKPLPPIITHPHRLSSYVRLLDDCSAKFYMYTHLKRHGQIPAQQQSQHQLEASQRAGEGATEPDAPCLESPRERSPCAIGDKGRLQSVLSATLLRGESDEMELRLPRSFIAAEKMLMGDAERSTRHPAKAAKQFKCSAPEQDGHRVSEDGKTGQSSSRRTSALKRPAVYDFILAAEHLGVGYQQLLKSAASSESLSRKYAAGVTLDGETDVWSEDEEDADSANLRELLEDDSEVAYYATHNYTPQSIGLKEGDPAAPGGEEPEENTLQGSESLRASESQGDAEDEVVRGASPSGLHGQRGSPERLPSAPVHRDAACMRNTYRRGTPARVTSGGGGDLGAYERGNVKGSQRWSDSHSFDTQTASDRLGSTTVKSAAAGALSGSRPGSAALTEARSWTANEDGDHKKHNTLSGTPPWCVWAKHVLASSHSGDHSNLSLADTLVPRQWGDPHDTDKKIPSSDSQVIRECGSHSVSDDPPFGDTATATLATDTRTCAEEDAHRKGTSSGGAPALQSRAAFRMQNTIVAPPLLVGKSVQSKRKSASSAGTAGDALLPRGAQPDAEPQWGWQWNFAVNNADVPSARKGIEEEGGAATYAAKERWWGKSCGPQRAFFRYRGKAYALLPGQGWKQVSAAPRRLLKPRKRRCNFALRRARRAEREARLRQVREELLGEQARGQRQGPEALL